jgi:hypothetical protein
VSPASIFTFRILTIIPCSTSTALGAFVSQQSNFRDPPQLTTLTDFFTEIPFGVVGLKYGEMSTSEAFIYL